VRVWWRVGGRSLDYDARIERVGAEIVSTTGGVEVFAVIEDHGKQTNLRPGAFVEVNLADKEYKNVLQAPESAIYGEDIVYVINDGRLAERRIQVLGYNGTDVLFRSAGDPLIVDGELIVTTELREAGAGAKVEVR
jgi:multidrug efflux pump subunit AcrA (membrane-fusion protein)